MFTPAVGLTLVAFLVLANGFFVAAEQTGFTAAALTRSSKSTALNSNRWPRNSTTKSSPEL